MKFPINRAFNDESQYFKRRREDEEKYVVGRPGDWLLAPFQCDECWFINLHGRKPLLREFRDQQELGLIRRANLDVLWSRESGTVKNLVSGIKDIIKRSNFRGRKLPLSEITAWSLEDECGMGIALLMLEKSLESGRNNVEYKQFDTVRKFRSTASNVYAATASANRDPRVLKSLQGAVLHMNSGSMQSVFMERFVMGMRARMPSESARNVPLLGHVVSQVLSRMDMEWRNMAIPEGRRRVIAMCGGYIATTFVYSLRGNEGFWVDGDRLKANIDLGKTGSNGEISHVVVSLLGRFKGEGGDRMHVFPLASRTKSGIETRIWLERVVDILRSEKLENSPAFCFEDGYQFTEKFVEETVLHPILEDLQRTGWNHGAIPKGIDVKQVYRCSRSFRRGAEISAKNAQVSDAIISFIHRWGKYEKKRGKQPGFNMLEHYADGINTRPLQLVFTSSV
jgi:hypothetical protein